MKSTTAYAIIWIVCGIAILSTVYMTKNANSLWGFFIPCFIASNVLSGREESEGE